MQESLLRKREESIISYYTTFKQGEYVSKTLSALNSKATLLFKENKMEEAVAVYMLMFEKAKMHNITHPEMHVCHGNCSAAYLRLEMFEKALFHAEKSLTMAEASLKRNFKGSSTYIKSFQRKGSALMGLGRYREAAMVFEKGLCVDALQPELKLGLERANQAVLKDLAEGKSHEHRTITYPESSQRISYHPYSAPLHKIQTDDLLPLKLLTPFQAENDRSFSISHLVPAMSMGRMHSERVCIAFPYCLAAVIVSSAVKKCRCTSGRTTWGSIFASIDKT